MLQHEGSDMTWEAMGSFWLSNLVFVTVQSIQMSSECKDPLFIGHFCGHCFHNNTWGFPPYYLYLVEGKQVIISYRTYCTLKRDDSYWSCSISFGKKNVSLVSSILSECYASVPFFKLNQPLSAMSNLYSSAYDINKVWSFDQCTKCFTQHKHYQDNMNVWDHIVVFQSKFTIFSSD